MRLEKASRTYGTQAFESVHIIENLVGLSGLEPPTSRLSGVRSNRLSYRPMQGIYGFLSLFTGLFACFPHLHILLFNVHFWTLENKQHSVLSTNRIFDIISLWYRFSLERRWSSRTFRYGYLVTTSPQLPTPPSTAASLRVSSQASGVIGSHGVTGGVYKARERIHRDILIRDY